MDLACAGRGTYQCLLNRFELVSGPGPLWTAAQVPFQMSTTACYFNLTIEAVRSLERIRHPVEFCFSETCVA